MIPKFIRQDSIGDYEFHPAGEPSPTGEIMWAGTALAVYEHADIHLSLSYRGTAGETPESLKPHLIIKRVVINGKSLDPHWHCLFTDGGMWYHWDGWFSSPTSAAIFAHPIVKGRNHRTKVEVFTQDQILTLATMGFKYLGEPIGISTDLVGDIRDKPLSVVIKLPVEDDGECAVDYGPEPDGPAWPLKPGLPPQEKLDGARLGPVELAETVLTPDNAQQGQTIRHCTDMPDKTTTLRRIRGAWSFENSAGTQCELPESHMCDWRIVSNGDANLVAPIIDLSVIKIVTTVAIRNWRYRIPEGTELLAEMIELDHIKVINGDDVNLPKFLRPDQYTIKIGKD